MRCIMTGRTKIALVLLALLLLFPAVLWAEPPEGREVTWKDYRTPLTGVPVLYTEATIIWVDLPAEFLEGRSQVTLVWTVMSQVYSSLDRKQKPTFESCQPQLRVGQGMATGLYGLPVDPQSGLATQRLEIKTKHLKPGRNRIKAMCDQYLWLCPSGQCQFVITEMYFQETITGAAASAKAPTTAEEDSGRQEEKQALARQWVENCALKSALPMLLRAKVSRDLPQNVQGEANRILSAKDWDPLRKELAQALAERCSFQVIEAMATWSCDKINKDEPCMADFLTYLGILLDREMILLRQELKKKFPDL